MKQYIYIYSTSTTKQNKQTTTHNTQQKLKHIKCTHNINKNNNNNRKQNKPTQHKHNIVINNKKHNPTKCIAATNTLRTIINHKHKTINTSNTHTKHTTNNTPPHTYNSNHYYKTNIKKTKQNKHIQQQQTIHKQI